MPDRDVMHVARPGQERIGRVRGALIAMPTAFDDKTQVVFGGKVRCGRDFGSISCGDSIHTGFGGPSVNPAQGLGYAGIVAGVVGILQICEESLAVNALRRGQARVDRKIDRDEIATNGIVETLPSILGRPTWVGRTDPANCGACEQPTWLWRQKGCRPGCLQEHSSIHLATLPS